VLRHTAILAPATSPLSNELADRVVHDYLPFPPSRNVRALACSSVRKLNDEM
jgi:hypothetical protein